MTSNWALPTIVRQYAETGAEDIDISWLEIDNFDSLKYPDGKFVKTSSELMHIARDPKHDIVQKTYFLELTGFNFTVLPNTLTGIEMKLSSRRFGRVTDETIQLSFNGLLVGDNQASDSVNPLTTYGSPSNLWGSSLNINNVTDSSFGVVLRFQSHPRWPHKNSAMIDTVQIRLY